MAAVLRYLDFDYSEDSDGNGAWDAMASVPAAQWSALRAEAAQVLAWAHREFGDQRGALEDGAEWDWELQAVAEVVTPQPLHFDSDTGTLQARDCSGGSGSGSSSSSDCSSTQRYTLSLSLSSTPAFSAALRAQFGLE